MFISIPFLLISFDLVGHIFVCWNETFPNNLYYMNLNCTSFIQCILAVQLFLNEFSDEIVAFSIPFWQIEKNNEKFNLVKVWHFSPTLSLCLYLKINFQVIHLKRFQPVFFSFVRLSFIKLLNPALMAQTYCYRWN